MKALYSLLLALTVATPVAAYQDHAPAPMLAQPKSALSTVKPQASVDQIRTEFIQAYRKKGQPRIAIFWNRQFDDQLSQWQVLARNSVSGSVDVTGFSNLQTNQADGSSSDDQPGRFQKKMKFNGSEYLEVRASAPYRAGLGEHNDFKFGAGFTQTLLAAKTTVIDRNSIMRLMESKQRTSGHAQVVSDQQQIETDALIGYADYLAEVVFTDDHQAPLGMSFMVTVKKVATGTVVAMFNSSGVAEKAPAKAQWTATASGYQQSMPDLADLSPGDVGKQLATETLAALTQVWR